MKAKKTLNELRDNKDDLGFGSRWSQQEHQRMMNRDGSFNVRRDGLHLLRSMSLYHWLISISWPRFLGLFTLFYFFVNILFALGYLAAGPDALNGAESTTFSEPFWNCFFFSLETFATIGYGALNPRNAAANWIMAMQSFFGFISAAMVTGLLFSRFSRPSAQILYSRSAVVAPFKEGKALMVRIINERSNQLINLEAQLIFSWMVTVGGKRIRQYHSLTLDRSKVTFFPLHWTIVHPIDAQSPLHAADARTLQESEAEMFVMITATDETYSQTVHSRSSYRYDEIIWNARFADMFKTPVNGRSFAVDIERLHAYELLSDAS